MQMKKLLSIVLSAAMLAAVCSGCGTKTNDEAGTDTGNTIKIGVFEPTTGENGGGGVQEVLGIRYAKSLRDSVTIDGTEYKIELVEVDNQSDKTAAVTAAQSLVSSGVKAVLGSYGSGVSIAAGSTFRDAQIPAVGVSCTNPQVTAGNDWYFRVCFLDPFQGTVMANYAGVTSGFKKAAVICQNGDDYSTGLASYFKNAFKGDIVYEGTYNTNESDFNAILTAAKAANPDVIFCPSSIATAGLVIKQARELGIECAIMAGDTWENETIIQNAGADNCKGVTFSTFFDENDPAAAEFVTGFKAYLNADKQNLKLNGNSDGVAAVSALGYDAYNVVLDAIERAQSTDTTAIRDALTQSDSVGITGPLSFDENGDAQKDMAYIKTIEDGKFKFIGTQKTDGAFTPVE
ncbi:MAG: ABC transporter substrate-binding protein [Clostridiales bacterium]|nr:ABC transporter substrate-binding protein [Clostridiales bacterium]